MTKQHPFEQFLDTFVPIIARKSKQLNKVTWILETTGSPDAVDLRADLDTELRLLCSDVATYEKLIAWDRDPAIQDPLLKRQLNVLIRTFKQNLVPKELLQEIAQAEAKLAQSYSQFRAEVGGKRLSENDIREILKRELDPAKRKEAWEASKQIGVVLAPQILSLVVLRNEAAKALDYSEYFSLQLHLQEVDEKWLAQTLDDLTRRSDAAYNGMLCTLERELAKKYRVSIEELGPWAWNDPFCQEDPLDAGDLDELVKEMNISDANIAFYDRMGFDVKSILARSDMEERPGKNQHAFCMHIDRNGDIRTLNNVRPSMQWLETVLHELGHSVYELGLEQSLPWLLREPPHMIPTEAMALFAGRQAYRYDALSILMGASQKNEALMRKGEESLRRRQLIFSRWVLAMTAFERELYKRPNQDLNALWWEMVAKYQRIRMPNHRQHAHDWATKYHIGLAPVYYFSYLLGEMFASTMEEQLLQFTGSQHVASEKSGQFLREKLFSPGNRMSWSSLIEHVTGKPLNADAWIRQFAVDHEYNGPKNVDQCLNSDPPKKEEARNGQNKKTIFP